jgi:hypothetical protein
MEQEPSSLKVFGLLSSKTGRTGRTASLLLQAIATSCLGNLVVKPVTGENRQLPNYRVKSSKRVCQNDEISLSLS